METSSNVQDKKYMSEAIRLSCEAVEKGGGPFGAVIVKDGKILSSSSNSVTLNNDPTAHAEVNAIRMACKKIKSFDLTGCTIYTSCEPCPMCLSAIYWARISRIFYANDRKDAKKIGFADDFIYDEIGKSVDDRSLPISQFMRTEALEAFRKWEEKTDKTEY